ncbi:MAG: hypothetical protein Q7R85_01350 [bacterium]|nr:hypothetical protein [bacterium]
MGASKQKNTGTKGSRNVASLLHCFIASHNGQSLVEVLVAIGIFLVITGSVVTMISGGQDLLSDTTQATQSAEYAAEGLEAVRAIRDADWGALTDGTHGITLSGNDWQFSGSSDARDIYTRSVSVATVDANTKIATTTVTWMTDPLRPQRIEIAQTLTAWQTASPTLCTLSGDWAHPRILGTADLGPGRSGTDVEVATTTVYVSSIASDSSKKDFSIYNASNPASLQLLGEVNVGGGINEFVLHSGYIFAVSSDDSEEFKVIDVRNPAAPVEVADINLGGSGNANSIAYWKDHVFIGRNYSSTYEELVVVDVTNPINPLIAMELDIGASMLKMYAFNDRLYSAYYNLTEDIIVRDITNPPAAPLVTTWDIGTDDVYGMYAGGDESVFMVGTDWGHTVKYVDATTVTSPITVASVDVGGRAWDVYGVGAWAVAGTDNSNAEFQVLDISTPSNMRVVASLNLSQLISATACYGNAVYAAVRSNDALQIIGPGL